ncbi:hypothetical protein F0L74_27140 [Chitinophaga agrisoli]|uniref:Ricin B lectin domain-containing protein n=1 Tax=Chitinophaga agrisoli TaxID=2607653 RepID=A0A5B2VLY2_9BACT|nr:RICIN domain-containing protein [Chitinophaga agrisoli]KAA2239864.1 hypothetical protein F0L74_27140 [Chitinophaga agrisoli]
MKKLKLFGWAAMACLQLCCAKPNSSEIPALHADPPGTVAANVAIAGTGDLADTNIKYFGRWDFTNPAQYLSYWGGAYLRVNFTGTTVKMKVGNATFYFVKIDNGPWTKYTTTAAGTVNLTPTPLANGTHTISIAQGKDYNYLFNFQGLVLDAGATTSPAPSSGTLIEWIGDSITAGYTDSLVSVSGYPWVCSEMLGTEHTQIAYPGICLASGFPAATTVGMDVQYFKLQNPSIANSPDWDFTRYTPKLVVINLGTNDNNQRVPDAQLQSTYTTFLTNVRAKFPNAEIFVMRTFLGVKATPTLAAVNARIAAGDAKLHYIDTNGWLTTADYNDGLHPSVAGNIKAANLLKPILQPYLTGTTQPLPNGTYKIVNRNSGMVLDAKDKLTANGTPIQQWTSSGATNQQWTVTALSNGTYKIIGVQSGRSLDVTAKSTANGAAIQLYDYKTSANENQNWIITPTSGGYYTVQALHSGSYMEVVGSSTVTGAVVQQWTNNNLNNQQWAFQNP